MLCTENKTVEEKSFMNYAYHKFPGILRSSDIKNTLSTLMEMKEKLDEFVVNNIKLKHLKIMIEKSLQAFMTK